MFYSWDEDHDGCLTDKEMIKPLVALGLAPNKKVARLICIALDPKGYLKTDGEPTLLTMDDFIKILKQDEISDRLMAQIDSTTKKRHVLMNMSAKQDKRVLYDPTNHFEQQESKRQLWL